MANWNLIQCVVGGKESTVKSLHKIMDDLAAKSKNTSPNGFGTCWLGDLINALGGDWKKIPCRGRWEGLEFWNGELYFDISATDVPYTLFSFIENHFNNEVKIYYFAEDSGNDVYETNDDNAFFFNQRYILDVNTPDHEYLDYAFETEKEVIEEIHALFDKQISSLKEIGAINDELKTIDIDYYCILSEVKVKRII